MAAQRPMAFADGFIGDVLSAGSTRLSKDLSAMKEGILPDSGANQAGLHGVGAAKGGKNWYPTDGGFEANVGLGCD